MCKYSCNNIKEGYPYGWFLFLGISHMNKKGWTNKDINLLEVLRNRYTEKTNINTDRINLLSDNEMFFFLKNFRILYQSIDTSMNSVDFEKLREITHANHEVRSIKQTYEAIKQKEKREEEEKISQKQLKRERDKEKSDKRKEEIIDLIITIAYYSISFGLSLFALYWIIKLVKLMRYL